MHRSTFWRFRRLVQVNMYLHLGLSEKHLIHIHRKHLKMVRLVHVNTLISSCNPTYRYSCNCSFTDISRHYSTPDFLFAWTRLYFCNRYIFHAQKLYRKWANAFWSSQIASCQYISSDNRFSILSSVVRSFLFPQTCCKALVLQVAQDLLEHWR